MHEANYNLNQSMNSIKVIIKSDIKKAVKELDLKAEENNVRLDQVIVEA